MIVWVVLIEEGGEIIQTVTVLPYVPVISPGAQTGLPAARIALCLKGESREHLCQELGHPLGMCRAHGEALVRVGQLGMAPQGSEHPHIATHHDGRGIGWFQQVSLCLISGKSGFEKSSS